VLRLTAETVIDTLEDAEGCAAFEVAVTADYDAQSAVERELVLRLASLLWRLRRATAIGSGPFKIQAKHLLQFRRRFTSSSAGPGDYRRPVPKRPRDGIAALSILIRPANQPCPQSTAGSCDPVGGIAICRHRARKSIRRSTQVASVKPQRPRFKLRLFMLV
jgi:hypothetical protein